jgi:hypothetical protein
MYGVHTYHYAGERDTTAHPGDHHPTGTPTETLIDGDTGRRGGAILSVILYISTYA